MWNSEGEEQDAKYVVEKIKKAFKLKRWSCSTSKIYKNRRDCGGRIYINLWKK